MEFAGDWCVMLLKGSLHWTPSRPLVIPQSMMKLVGGGAVQDLDCLPIDKCAPSQYTFESNGLKDLSTYTTTSFKYPTCTSSSKAYLSVYAAVDVVAEGKACPTNVD